LKSSNIQALANIIKSFVGVGILALPYAMREAGIYFGVLMMLLIAILSNYCFKLVINCKTLLNVRDKKHCTTFQDVGRETLGVWGDYGVKISLILSQFGTAVIYIIYIADNLESMLSSHVNINVRLYMVMLIPILAILLQLRDLKYLSPTSVIGIIAVVIACIVVLYYGFTVFPDQTPKSFPFVRITTVAYYFGIAVFALEGIFLVVPIEDNMKNQWQYPLMLDVSMIFVTFLYLTFGFLGYLLFGDNVCSVITNNLPVGAVVVIIVQICLIVELIFSYPLQISPVVNLIENAITNPEDRFYELKRTLIRICLVLVTVGLAVVVPLFDLVTNLVGAFSNTFAGFILPVAFHIKLFYHKMHWTQFVFDILVLLFGTIGGGTATVLTVIKIVDTIASGKGIGW